MIGRIDTPQIEKFLCRRAQGSEFSLINVRHDQQGWAGVEVMAVAAKTVTAPTRPLVFFEHGHVDTALSQMGRCRNAANPRPNNNRPLCFHILLPRLLMRCCSWKWSQKVSDRIAQPMPKTVARFLRVS